MKRAAFFQYDLGVGGIQKSLTNLLRNLDYSALNVDLYLSEKRDGLSELLPGELNIKYLAPPSRIFSFIPFDQAMKLARPQIPDCGEYDLAVDFNSYQFICAAGALTVPAKRRVMWVHNDVEIKLKNEWKYRVLWNCFKGKFKYFDGFVGVSEGVREPFLRAAGLDRDFRVIQNYIDLEEIAEKLREEPEDLDIDRSCVNFVALGRLCHQKGYDIMLNVFREACENREDLRLYIIGGGPDMAALTALADKLGLAGKVFFLGNRDNPFCIMKHMDAFISTSRYEGQGMNIAEAMAVGLPVYCPKRLENYMGGFEGYEDGELASAVAAAGKAEKKPVDLSGYNRRILDAVAALIGE